MTGQGRQRASVHGLARRRPRADADATQKMLHNLLFSKNVGEDLLAEQTGAAHHSPAGVGTTIDETLRLVNVFQREPKMLPPRSLGGGRPSSPVLKKSASMELEAERDSFVNAVCTDYTHHQVRHWVDKIFHMTHNAAETEAKDRRRRRLRSSCAGSESGMSGQTGATGYTGVTGTTGTPLQPESVFHASPKSAVSDESLVVHHSKGDEPLSVKERLQAFLQHRIPELDEHINSYVAVHTEELQKLVDEEMAGNFLRNASDRDVFDNRANYLRWQNARQKILQKKLDDAMGQWILQAIQTWDQKKADQKPKEMAPADRMYEYLTKRAAHIDSGKLPSRIPVFKTLHSSYSLPAMWRDKYDK